MQCDTASTATATADVMVLFKYASRFRKFHNLHLKLLFRGLSRRPPVPVGSSSHRPSFAPKIVPAGFQAISMLFEAVDL